MTIFLGCGFAAKYREGGGNFSVPLQWMLGLRRLKLDAIWLELLPATNDLAADEVRIQHFQSQLRTHGLAGRYCLLYQKPASDTHDLDNIRCIGRHFIPWWTQNGSAHDRGRVLRNLRLLGNGIGVAP